MKIVIYGQELLSVLLTPLVLWYSLPQCAPAIIDFFREFSVHVDGLGYVCSFAVFDFQRHGNVKVGFVFIATGSGADYLQFGAPTTVNDERLMSKEGKMEKSFLNFKVSLILRFATLPNELAFSRRQIQNGTPPTHQALHI